MYVDQARHQQALAAVDLFVCNPIVMVPYKRDDTTLDCDIDVATIDMCLLGTIKADDPRTIPEYGQLLIHGVTPRPPKTHVSAHSARPTDVQVVHQRPVQRMREGSASRHA